MANSSGVVQDQLLTKSITSFNYRGSSKPLNSTEQDMLRVEQIKMKLDFIATHPDYERVYET